MVVDDLFPARVHSHCDLLLSVASDWVQPQPPREAKTSGPARRPPRGPRLRWNRMDLDPLDTRCIPPRPCPDRIGARRTWRGLLVSTGMRRSGRRLARRIEETGDGRHAEVWAGRRISVDGREMQ
jgi:hypothetical protein